MIETIDLDRDGNSCWILFPLLFERARINSFFFFLAGNKSRSVRGLERFVRELDTSQCLSTSSHTAFSFNYKLPSTGTMHIFSRAHLFAPRASIVLWKYIPYIYIIVRHISYQLSRAILASYFRLINAYYPPGKFPIPIIWRGPFLNHPPIINLIFAGKSATRCISYTW